MNSTLGWLLFASDLNFTSCFNQSEVGVKLLYYCYQCAVKREEKRRVVWVQFSVCCKRKVHTCVPITRHQNVLFLYHTFCTYDKKFVPLTADIFVPGSKFKEVLDLGPKFRKK